MSLEPDGGPWSVYPLEDGDELHVLLDYMPYVPAYQCYKGPGETWDEAIRAHEDVERALALLRRIYGEEEGQNERCLKAKLENVVLELQRMIEEQCVRS